jgi:hypothetical protein
MRPSSVTADPPIVIRSTAANVHQVPEGSPPVAAATARAIAASAAST